MNKIESLTLIPAHGNERAGKHTYLFSKNRKVKIQKIKKSRESLDRNNTSLLLKAHLNIETRDAAKWISCKTNPIE